MNERSRLRVLVRALGVLYLTTVVALLALALGVDEAWLDPLLVLTLPGSAAWGAVRARIPGTGPESLAVVVLTSALLDVLVASRLVAWAARRRSRIQAPPGPSPLATLHVVARFAIGGRGVACVIDALPLRADFGQVLDVEVVAPAREPLRALASLESMRRSGREERALLIRGIALRDVPDGCRLLVWSIREGSGPLGVASARSAR